MSNIAADLATARDFMRTIAPAPQVASLAGSRSGGTASDGSDFDLVLLFRNLPTGAWRSMVRHQGQDFEIFAHDLGTLAYFFEFIERPSGKPALIRMVHESKPLTNEDPHLLAQAWQTAAAALAALRAMDRAAP